MAGDMAGDVAGDTAGDMDESAPNRTPIRTTLLNGWAAIAARFGFVQTLVILALFYALLLGPVALVITLARRDFLAKRGLGSGG